MKEGGGVGKEGNRRGGGGRIHRDIERKCFIRMREGDEEKGGGQDARSLEVSEADALASRWRKV